MGYYFRYLYGEFEEKQKHKILVKDRVQLKTERIPILATKSSGGWYYMNAETGRTQYSSYEELEEPNKKYQVIDTRKKAEIYGVKVMYDEAYDMPAFIICKMDSSKIIKNPSPRKWEEICRIYLYKEPEKQICLLRNKMFYRPRKGSYNWAQLTEEEFLPMPLSLNNMDNVQSYCRCVLIDSPCWLEDKEGERTWDWTEALQFFRDKYGDIVPIAGNRMVALDNPSALFCFLKSTNISVPNNKNQRRLEELLADILPDAGEAPSDLEMPNYHYKVASGSASENTQKYAVIQRVACEKPMCVLRTFFKSPGLDVTREGGRIYIGKDEVISSRIDNEGRFIYQRLLDLPQHWDFYIKDFDPEIVKGTKLEYYANIMGNIAMKSRGMAIWMFLKEPLLERMYKCEALRPIMDKVLQRNLSKPFDSLKDIFGSLNMSKKDVYQIIGLNKQQVELLVPYVVEHMPLKTEYGYCMNRSLIVQIKIILKGANVYSEDYDGDISDVDMETIKLLKDALAATFDEKTEKYVTENSGNYVSWKSYSGKTNIREMDNLANSLSVTNSVWGTATMRRMVEPLSSVMGKEAPYATEPRYYGYYRTATNLYQDYCRMVKELAMQHQLKPYFSDVNDIVSMHDIVTELYNSKKNAIEYAKWEQRRVSAKWSKWEYENALFKAVAPIKAEELAKEGICLHHCVKSYIGRVTNGSTNIMFIRKVEEPDIPFYTVEVSNEGVIEQVHGLKNCNASEYPGLTEFVNEWVKARKLKKSASYDKVR